MKKLAMIPISRLDCQKPSIRVSSANSPRQPHHHFPSLLEIICESGAINICPTNEHTHFAVGREEELTFSYRVYLHWKSWFVGTIFTAIILTY
jgi:hypothetical protein